MDWKCMLKICPHPWSHLSSSPMGVLGEIVVVSHQELSPNFMQVGGHHRYNILNSSTAKKFSLLT